MSSIFVTYLSITDPSRMTSDQMLDQLVALFAQDIKPPASVRFSYFVTEADAGYSLKCDSYFPGPFQDQFEAPAGGLNSVSMSIVDPDDIELTVDYGFVVYPNPWSLERRVGMKAGDRLKATCKVRRKGFDSVNLVMQVGEEELTDPIATANHEEVSIETTDGHIAKKEYHGLPVTCFIRDERGNMWGAAKDTPGVMNVLFEPTASVDNRNVVSGNVIAGSNRSYSVRTVPANRPASITCKAEPGNPESYRWSFEAKEEGNDSELAK